MSGFPGRRPEIEQASTPSLYGGQAVIEGVVIRGRRTVALACRRPSGTIYRYREPSLSPALRGRLTRAPFVRGIVTLADSLSVGLRMLMRSADMQLEQDGQGGGSAPAGPRGTIAGVGIIAFAGALALGVFVGIPYVASQALGGAISSTVGLNLAEGLVRLGLLLAYLVAISFMPDIRRVFAYHGAEHMTIHAFEHGDPLVVARVRPYPTAHPRCGTAFLLFVVLVAVLVFAFVPRVNVAVDVLVRLVLVLPVAAISYEVLRLGARHERNPLVRALVAPGLLLQRITTRRPDDRMIEVAIASLEEALAGDSSE